MRPIHRLGIAAALACAPVAVAQTGGEGPRRPTFARVVTADGEPLPGAVVTFAGWVPHVGTLAAPLDVQVVAADARGRAQGRLAAGLCYVAWAAAEVDGQRSIAEVRGHFGAGALLELVCRTSDAARRLQVDGVEAWSEFGPLRLFAVTPSPGVEAELELRDGVVEVPPLPRWNLEVRTRDNAPLCQFWAPGDKVTVPPPQQLAVRVVDENGKPLPGASVVQRVGRLSSWGIDGFVGAWDYLYRPLGVVGADGTATVTICCPGDLLRENVAKDALLFARAPGRAAVAGGRYYDAFYVDDRKVPQAPQSVLQFTCRPVEPLTGYVGAVPPGTVAHLSAVCKLFSSANSYYHDLRTFDVPVGADGTVRFTEVPGDIHCCHLTLLTANGEFLPLPLLPATSGRTLPLGQATPEAPAVLPTAVFALQVVDAQGGPARGGALLVVPGDVDGVLVRDAAVQVPLDASGEVRLRLVPGKWFVMAVTGEGWGAEGFDLEPGERSERLAMAPLAHMQVRLLDGDGAPVPGARVVARGTSTRASGDPRQRMLQGLQHASEAEWSHRVTDADGRVTLPFVPVDGYTRRLRLESGDRRSPEFELTDAGETFDVRLE